MTNNKSGIIRGLIFLVTITVFVLIIYYANRSKPEYLDNINNGTEYETAKVIDIIEDNAQIDDTMEGILRGSRLMEVEILTGRYKGEVVEVMNYFSTLNNVDVGVKDRLTVRIETEADDRFSVSVYSYYRQNYVISMVVTFSAVLVVIGGKKGFMSIVSLILAFISIVYILIPLLLKGFPVLFLTVTIIGIIAILNFYFIGGVQKKTIAAFVGTMTGVCIAALLAYFSSEIAGMTGFQMDEAESLIMIKSETWIQVKDLFVSGILISALGAVMNVAMTIASAVHEVKVLEPKINRKKLFLYGMNVGRDIIGTMSNTLILAFAGTSLCMMILIYSYGVTYIQLMNTDFIAMEVIRGIAGCMGIVFTVPAVAYISAVLEA